MKRGKRLESEPTYKTDLEALEVYRTGCVVPWTTYKDSEIIRKAMKQSIERRKTNLDLYRKDRGYEYPQKLLPCMAAVKATLRGDYYVVWFTPKDPYMSYCNCTDFSKAYKEYQHGFRQEAFTCKHVRATLMAQMEIRKGLDPRAPEKDN